MHQWRRQIAESSNNLNFLTDPQLNIILGNKKGASVGRVFGTIQECSILVPKNYSCLIMGYEVNTKDQTDRSDCELWASETKINSSYANLGYRKQYGLLIPESTRIYLKFEYDETTSCLIDYILLDSRVIDMRKSKYTVIK